MCGERVAEHVILVTAGDRGYRPAIIEETDYDDYSRYAWLPVDAAFGE